jgi:DNA-binding MarR family transcriptional regulator
MTSSTDRIAQKPTQQETPGAAETLFNAPVALLTTPTQDSAIRLYELGFNVIPIPYARKGGWPWKPFQYVRIHPSQLVRLFESRCNLAVMTGRTSDNLFVIDCETEESYRQQGDELRRAGIPLWSARSGGGGGHYYLRCAESEVANMPSGELHDVEVRGNRCYVLAPPSVHPTTGVLYQWDKREGNTPPQVSIQDIDWLPVKLATRAKKAARQMPAAFSELSSQTRDFILNGAIVGERNNRLFAAACDMAGNNYDDHTVRQVLLPVAIHCGLPDREARDTLRSAFSRPREPARKNQPSQEPKRWEKAAAWAEQQQWSGRTGQTDRAAFLACCERASLASNENNVFRASVREIAELARTTPKTASVALRRLQKAGFLEHKGTDITSHAKLWKLGKETNTAPERKTEKGVRNYYTNPTWLSSSVVITHSDAAEWRALGKTAAVVYQGLLGQVDPVMPALLAERLKLSRYQVQRALKKLQGYNLVRREKAGWVGVAVDGDWLDENVSAVAGTLGKGEARKQQHAEQRAKRAGDQLLRAQLVEEHRQAVRLEALSDEGTARHDTHGFLYCQNCGQSIFVFEGCFPPRVCDFCAENYGWKQSTIWRPDPPNPPLSEDRRRKKGRASSPT